MRNPARKGVATLPKSEPPRLPMVSFRGGLGKEVMLLQPRNWAKFQHYKDRCPPWIKLHRDLLIDREFMCLPLASKALAPLLWLLASESKDGTFDASTEELAFRLHLSPTDIEKGLKPLIDKGFFIVDSTMLAERKQVDIPETETETEKETKKKAAVAAPPEGVSKSVWEDFVQLRKVKKAPITPSALSGIMREAAKSRWTLEQALTECCARGWVGFKAEWVQGAPSGMTVPGNPERDPALVKMERDRKHAAPISPEIRQQLQTILRR